MPPAANFRAMRVAPEREDVDETDLLAVCIDRIQRAVATPTPPRVIPRMSAPVLRAHQPAPPCLGPRANG
jgi:hypothetical protein